MFTGLVEEIGILRRIQTLSQGKTFFIDAQKICSDLEVDDSVAVNGVCLTAIEVRPNGFAATAVQETLNRSTLKHIRPGDRVNLERAMRASDRMGGHMVQGHVDGIGAISKIEKSGTGTRISFTIPQALGKYCVEKGSVCVNGVSLTIAEIDKSKLTAAVIPHTYGNTVFQFLEEGSEVNIEVDILAKYVEKMLNRNNQHSGRDEGWYRSHGF